jgi:type IV pilus assembly protein PilA
MAIAPATGAITVTMAVAATSGLPAAVLSQTVVFTPNVQNLPLGAISGAIDWACASSTNVTATTKGLTAVQPGSVPAKYVPAECR